MTTTPLVLEKVRSGRVTQRRIATIDGTVNVHGRNLAATDTARVAEAVAQLAQAGTRRAWYHRAGRVEVTLSYGRGFTPKASLTRSRLVLGRGWFGLTARVR